jgi:hypothetical protein
MKIFLLSGQSILNKEWIEEVEVEFKKEFQDTSVLYYDHWSSGSKNIDLEKESSKLIEMINEYEREYLVFAKSIGTIVFYNIFEKLKMKPNGVLMVGVPYDLAFKMGFDMSKLNEKVDFNINIYQKNQDPFGNLKKVKDMEGGKVSVNEYICTDEDNDNHHYANTKYLSELMSDLL